jgi:hypothetical protein
MARIPVSGVRTSWAKVASAVSTMPGAAVLRADLLTLLAAALLMADLRGLPAAAPALRLFGRAFFIRRFLRPRRELNAMIPPILAEHTMAWPGLWSHAEAKILLPGCPLLAAADATANFRRGHARGP